MWQAAMVPRVQLSPSLEWSAIDFTSALLIAGTWNAVLWTHIPLTPNVHSCHYCVTWPSLVGLTLCDKLWKLGYQRRGCSGVVLLVGDKNSWSEGRASQAAVWEPLLVASSCHQVSSAFCPVKQVNERICLGFLKGINKTTSSRVPESLSVPVDTS